MIDYVFVVVCNIALRWSKDVTKLRCLSTKFNKESYCVSKMLFGNKSLNL